MSDEPGRTPRRRPAAAGAGRRTPPGRRGRHRPPAPVANHSPPGARHSGHLPAGCNDTALADQRLSSVGREDLCERSAVPPGGDGRSRQPRVGVPARGALTVRNPARGPSRGAGFLSGSHRSSGALVRSVRLSAPRAVMPSGPGSGPRSATGHAELERLRPDRSRHQAPTSSAAEGRPVGRPCRVTREPVPPRPRSAPDASRVALVVAVSSRTSRVEETARHQIDGRSARSVDHRSDRCGGPIAPTRSRCCVEGTTAGRHSGPDGALLPSSVL